MSRLLGNESCIERHQCRLVCPSWFEDSNKRSKSSLFFLQMEWFEEERRDSRNGADTAPEIPHQTQQRKKNKPRI